MITFFSEKTQEQFECPILDNIHTVLMAMFQVDLGYLDTPSTYACSLMPIPYLLYASNESARVELWIICSHRYNHWALTAESVWPGGIMIRALANLRLWSWLSTILISGNNLRQVVHTYAPVTKQYKSVPVKGWWCSIAGKVTVVLALHWPCFADLIG